MKELLKSYLLQGNLFFYRKNYKHFLMPVVFLFAINVKSQITNYVSNGSFESLNTYSTVSQYYCVNYWQSIDTNKASYYLLTLLPPVNNAPYTSGFQLPRTGNNFIISQFIAFRGYPRNRLKQKLIANTAYCVKFHVVNTNNNPYAIGSFGAYFGNSSLDTIKQCNLPLVYLTPQIQHSNSNIIADTLNWVPITGTFVADGTEKYMVIGNFRSDAMTNTLLINPTYSTTITSDICIDDVSCIELNLPAFAGRDTSVAPSTNIFLGRQPDVGIDEACVWYKLPSTTPVDTVAGFWVAPTVTSTYVVVQTICGLVKSDTVVIHMNLVGLEKIKALNDELIIYPTPAQDIVYFKVSNEMLVEDFKSLIFLDNLGQLIREEEIKFFGGKVSVGIENLPNGYYTVIIKNGNNEQVIKKLLIAR